MLYAYILNTYILKTYNVPVCHIFQALSEKTS